MSQSLAFRSGQVTLDRENIQHAWENDRDDGKSPTTEMPNQQKDVGQNDPDTSQSISAEQMAASSIYTLWPDSNGNKVHNVCGA